MNKIEIFKRGWRYTYFDQTRPISIIITYSYTFHAVFRVEKCKKDDNRDANSPQISNCPRSMEKKARVCWSNSAMREYRGALFLVESWEKSSLDRPALPPPPCVVGEAQQNGSRGVASAARNGNTGDRSAGLPVFVPVLRGFSRTRPRSFRSYTLARARFLRLRLR